MHVLIGVVARAVAFGREMQGIIKEQYQSHVENIRRLGAENDKLQKKNHELELKVASLEREAASWQKAFEKMLDKKNDMDD